MTMLVTELCSSERGRHVVSYSVPVHYHHRTYTTDWKGREQHHPASC